MNHAISARVLALFAGALVATAPLHAQDSKKAFEPHVGQQGKDVIWVPTPDEVVDRMLRMAQTTANDYVIDLGAGDGKIAIAAAKKYNARALGIEYNPDMVKHAMQNVEKAGVGAKARVIQGDIFVTDFTQATVLTMYLLPALNLKLRPQVLAMRPGTRVASHSFNMEDWEPDETSSMDGRKAYLWIVPAPVNGNWTLETGSGKSDVTLEQRYQKVDGTITLGPIQAGLREMRLRGFNLSFAYVDNNGVRRDFTGRVTGNRMEGSYRGDNGTEGRWNAVKK